jgi:hypothetical protein
MDPVTVVSIVQLLRRARRRKGFKDMFGMKNALALVGLVVVGFAVAGWYLGWYGVSTTVDNTGKSTVGVNINSGQVVKDLKKAEREVVDFIEQSKGNVVHVTSGTEYGPPEVPPLPSLPPTQNYSTPQMPQNYPTPQPSQKYDVPSVPQSFGSPQYQPKLQMNTQAVDTWPAIPK